MGDYLYGFHDVGGEHLMLACPGWITVTVSLKDGERPDLAGYSNQGFTVIARLNWAHNGVDGTIPMPPDYGKMADACAAFVQASPTVRHFVIGNEPNHINERPYGNPITPEQYATCFNLCRDKIKAVRPDVYVLLAAVAPWDQSSGDWLDYFKRIATLCNCDGFVFHAYTHGSDPHLITSEEMVHGWHWHFRVYRDSANAVPANKRHLDIYITEWDQADLAWLDTNSGYVVEGYREIDNWNRQPNTQKIKCLCLYRWKIQPGDKWHIEDKPQVQADFQAAVNLGLRSPSTSPAPAPTPTPPQPAPEPEPEDSYLLEWDERLDQRGTWLGVVEGPGGKMWHVRRGRWFDEAQAGGRVSCFVRVQDEAGNLLANIPVRWFWGSGGPGEEQIKPSEIKSDPWLEMQTGNAKYSLDFPMNHTAPTYGLQIADGLPSDILQGMGLGDLARPGMTIHTAYLFEIQRLESKPKPEGHTEYVCVVMGANLRDDPSTSAPVLVAVPYGEAVMVTGTVMGADGYAWRGVEYQGIDGFIRGDLLSRQAPAPIPPPDPGTGEVTHPLPGSIVTQHWGENGEDYAQWGLWGHDGCDFGGKPAGTPIVSLADGDVTWVGYDAKGYGNFLEIWHKALGVSTVYCHATAINVRVGMAVKKGDAIATVGSTGNSTGPHLHLEVRLRKADGTYQDGTPMPRGRVDPETFCILRGLKL